MTSRSWRACQIWTTAALALLGCSSTHGRAPEVAQAPLGNGSLLAPLTLDTSADENPYAPAAQDGRSVGDWVATQFVNAGNTITVQQRVLSRDGAQTITEVAIRDGSRSQTFRVRTESSRGGEQVLDVTRLEGGVEHASTAAAYDAALQRTVPAVDRNDGVVDTEPVTVDVGSRKIEATRTTYKVMVAGKPATMSVVHADGFAWGDLGGDIVTQAGKVLYSTKVTEAGGTDKAVARE